MVSACILFRVGSVDLSYTNRIHILILETVSKILLWSFPFCPISRILIIQACLYNNLAILVIRVIGV